ncbi:hypothetical protein [Pseudomonas pseudonitroreducens]|uniref:hypothetical protein n=1 Tax=Pseudomonas pseudonitroreducens TaxID=2892326 RepID=UPI001F18CA5B|nr:hypothetical protein [Pseudomonas pseudonitroreducens]
MAIKITDYDEMLRQAPDAVHSILFRTVGNIDDVFGKGYAKEHPDLVAECVKAAMNEFNNATTTIALQEASERIAGAIELAGRAIQCGLDDK